METSRKDNPFVHVYAANEDTIAHFRQLIYVSDGDQSSPKELHDGVIMTLMQFRSLMFHLRELDAQFMQGLEMRLTSPCENESKHVGETRTRTDIENLDDDDAPTHKIFKHDQTDATA